MERLKDTVRRIVRNGEHGWELDGDAVVVSLGKTCRRQQVAFERQGDDYVFTSMIVGNTRVTGDDKKWSDYARLAWDRNAKHEFVTFAFDKKDRLLGTYTLPIQSLDDDILVFLISHMARECDRFEYLLTGGDRF